MGNAMLGLMSEKTSAKQILNWLPLSGLVLLLLLFTGLLALRFEREQLARQQNWIDVQASRLHHAVTEGYGRHMQVMQQWQRYWNESGQLDSRSAKLLMRAYMEDHPEVKAMGLVKGLAWFALSARQETLWQEDASLPRRHAGSIEQARFTGKLAIPPDFSFPNGGSGVYIYWPLQLSTDWPEVAMIALSVRRFMERLVQDQFADLPVRVLVRDEKHRLLFDSATEETETGVMSHFQLDPDGDGAPWEFVVMLSPQGLQPVPAFWYLTLFSATALLLLLLLLVWVQYRRSLSLARVLEQREQTLQTQLETICEANEAKDFLLFHDPVTRLPNRNALNRALGELVRDQHASGDVLFCIKWLDHQRYRELYGHNQGKEIMRLFVERMQAFLQDEGLQATVYALEEGKFAVWVKAMPEKPLAEVHQRWLEQAEQQPMQWQGLAIPVRTAVGLALLEVDCYLQPETWLLRAETALYQAQQVGHGGFVVHRKGMVERARRQMELGAHLLDFLREGYFQLYYQPVVELASGRIHSVEALLRLQHPDLGLVAPSLFIPLAEANGAIAELEQWVLRQACRDWEQLKPRLPANAKLELNVFPKNWRDGKRAKQLLELLQSFSIPPEDIILNLTHEPEESELPWMTPILKMMAGAGIALALDVTSLHIASLSRLKKMQLNWLKIDRSVTTRLFQGEGASAVVHSLLEMAHQLQVEVVAEGLETGTAEQWLMDAGCRFAQGYYLYTPLPLHTLLDRLSDTNTPLEDDDPS